MVPGGYLQTLSKGLGVKWWKLLGDGRSALHNLPEREKRPRWDVRVVGNRVRFKHPVSGLSGRKIPLPDRPDWRSCNNVQRLHFIHVPERVRTVDVQTVSTRLLRGNR